MKIAIRSVKIILLASALLLVCPSATLGQEENPKSVLRRAEQGDSDAQNEAGYMYHEGVGVKRNLKKAVYWYRKSAEQAYALGACNLGLSYGMGQGVEKNLTLAMKWLFIATALSAIKCHFGDYVPLVVKPSQRHVNRGHKLAVAWLRARPHLKDGFGERPWMEPRFDEPPQLHRRAKSNNSMQRTRH
jgi:Sel1 repeat